MQLTPGQVSAGFAETIQTLAHRIVAVSMKTGREGFAKAFGPELQEIVAEMNARLIAARCHNVPEIVTAVIEAAFARAHELHAELMIHVLDDLPPADTLH